MMSPRIGKRSRKKGGESTGTAAVVGNDDLLTEILLRLPVRSLFRFDTVSPHWHSLISNPHFLVLQSKRCCKHVSGLLLNPRDTEDAHEFELVPLDHDCHVPSQSFDFLDGLEPLQYCNGLLLCKTERKPSTETEYYVINLTTKQHHAGVSFPVNEFPGKDLGLYSVALAFDPRKSPHFKLICLFRCSRHDLAASYYRVQIYSSETGLTTQLSDVFRTNSDCLLHRGLYWNGAINWIDYISGLYFNVGEERFGILPMPPAHRNEYGSYHRVIRYYGESNDHLYLVQTDTSPVTQFDVYEMDREYSGWFVRFHVDLRPMFRAFPAKSNGLREDFSILSVVDEDDGENSFIVFGRPGKAIRFHLKDGIFTKLCDFSGVSGEDYLPLWSQSIQLIQSLHKL